MVEEVPAGGNPGNPEPMTQAEREAELARRNEAKKKEIAQLEIDIAEQRRKLKEITDNQTDEQKQITEYIHLANLDWQKRRQEEIMKNPTEYDLLSPEEKAQVDAAEAFIFGEKDEEVEAYRKEWDDKRIATIAEFKQQAINRKKGAEDKLEEVKQMEAKLMGHIEADELDEAKKYI